MALDVGRTQRLVFMAEYELRGMEPELRQPTILYSKGKLNETKAKLGYSLINRYLTDNKELTKIADGKDLASLPQETQDLAVWLDKTMTSLATLDPLLDKAWKIAKKGPDGQENKILQHAKLCVKEVRTPPKYLAKLVKRMVQGEVIEGPDKEQVHFLPVALACWAVADLVDDAIQAKPR